MQAVGIRDLKNRLSQFLKAVRQGEVVLVTEHGKVIAQITPPPRYVPAAAESEEQALTRLARSGVVRMGTGVIASADADDLPAPVAPIDLAAALAETRGDRF